MAAYLHTQYGRHICTGNMAAYLHKVANMAAYLHRKYGSHICTNKAAHIVVQYTILQLHTQYGSLFAQSCQYGSLVPQLAGYLHSCHIVCTNKLPICTNNMASLLCTTNMAAYLHTILQLICNILAAYLHKQYGSLVVHRQYGSLFAHKIWQPICTQNMAA